MDEEFINYSMYPTVALARSTAFVILVSLSPGIIRAQSVPEPLTISRPEVGLIENAYVGGAVWVSDTQRVLGGARVTHAVRQRKFVKVYDVPAYAPLTQTRSKAAFKACLETGTCLLDDDGDGKFDRIARDLVARAYKLDVPVPYERTGVLEPGSKVSREVRLLDVNSQAIRFSYKETQETQPLAASEEILTFDRRTGMLPKAVSFRGLRLTILEATTKSIRYRIDEVPGP